ncbi:MAG: cation:proton antiporter regulatory subunit [Rubrobacteraceae bacterium]
MEIRETDLPGIGKKFQADVSGGERIVIVIHDDGRREIYQFDEGDYDECVASITFEDAEARQIAGILGGMAYTPKAMEKVEMAFDELLIEWYRVESGSEAEGRTIGDLGVRRNFGTTIVAIIEDDKTQVVNPGPEAVIKAGATLVVAGERQQVNRLRDALSAERG